MIGNFERTSLGSTSTYKYFYIYLPQGSNWFKYCGFWVVFQYFQMTWPDFHSELENVLQFKPSTYKHGTPCIDCSVHFAFLARFNQYIGITRKIKNKTASGFKLHNTIVLNSKTKYLSHFSPLPSEQIINHNILMSSDPIWTMGTSSKVTCEVRLQTDVRTS